MINDRQVRRDITLGMTHDKTAENQSRANRPRDPRQDRAPRTASVPDFRVRSAFGAHNAMVRKVMAVPVASATIDPRSAALFRVSLGVCIAVDVAMTWRDCCDHYSDEGVILSHTATPCHPWPNLHAVHASCRWTTVLFSAQAALGISVALGISPNACCAIAWFLSCSQARRNPFVQHGGDCLLRITCLWAAFMPLGSSDASVHLSVLGQRLSTATMYASTAVFKLSTRSWRQGRAVQEALSCCEYATYWGELLREAPVICMCLTWTTLILELAAPFLILALDGRPRTLAVLVFVAMHASMAATMSLGNFGETPSPLFTPPAHHPRACKSRAPAGMVSVVGLLPLVPSCAWPVGDAPRRERMRCAGGWGAFASNVACICLMAIQLKGTYHSHAPDWQHQPEHHGTLVAGLGLAVRWNMFAPPPRCPGRASVGPFHSFFPDARRLCAMYAVPALTDEFHMVDARRALVGGEGTAAPFPSAPLTPESFRQPTSRWHALYEGLYSPRRDDRPQMLYIADAIAAFYCRRLRNAQYVWVLAALQRRSHRYRLAAITAKRCDRAEPDRVQSQSTPPPAVI